MPSEEVVLEEEANILIQSTKQERAADEVGLLQATLQPCVSVIIVHYSGVELLHNCLKSLFNTRYNNFQVVLVDNGSKDGSVDFVKRVYGDRLDMIRSEVNLGFVGGNNLALRRVRSNYVVLLNDDTVVTPDWLRYLVDIAESDPSIGACQPKLLSLADPRYFEYNGGAGGLLDVYGVPLCRGRIFDVIEEDKGQYDTLAEVFWAGGPAIFIRRQALDEAGLLDENFYAHMEEIDLCWRIKLIGRKIISVPKSIVYHLGGGTSLPEKFYLKHRNNLIMMLKNYSTLSLLRFFTMRMALDMMSFIYFLTKKDRNRSFCIPKAYTWLLKNFSKVYGSRRCVQKLSNVSDEKIIKTMIKKSAAIQHYIMKRKYFSQIE